MVCNLKSVIYTNQGWKGVLIEQCCYHIYTYIKYIQKYAPSSYNFGHSIIKMYFQEFNCDVFTYDVTTYTTQFI